MEFLNFFAQRLNVSASEASKVLEETLNNYRPTRDYSTRMPDLRSAGGSTPKASSARAFAAHRSSQPNCASVPGMRDAHLEQ